MFRRQLMSAKYSINLLQPELLPEKVLVTLPRVVAVWGLAFVIMLAWALFTHYQASQLSNQHSIVKQDYDKAQARASELEQQIATRRVDSHLAEKLAVMTLLMKHKHALHDKLTDPSRTFVTGFAAAMEELSAMHHQDIRLKEIHINNDDMSFTGLAKAPEAVPAWLAGFENSVLLSGKSFVHFKLSKNEQDMTEFVVSSKSSVEESDNE